MLFVPARSLSWISATVTAATLLVSGCASFGAGPSSVGTASHVDLDNPALRPFAVANMTQMERDQRIENGDREAKSDGITPPLFWTGLGVGTVGAVGGIVFGVAGFVAKNQVISAYNDGSGLTVDEHERLVRNGTTYNGLAIGFTTAAVLGYALAVITYGIDWTRCGPLAEKRRHCKELGLGRHAR